MSGAAHPKPDKKEDREGCSMRTRRAWLRCDLCLTALPTRDATVTPALVLCRSCATLLPPSPPSPAPAAQSRPPEPSRSVEPRHPYPTPPRG